MWLSTHTLSLFTHTHRLVDDRVVVNPSDGDLTKPPAKFRGVSLVQLHPPLHTPYTAHTHSVTYLLIMLLTPPTHNTHTLTYSYTHTLTYSYTHTHTITDCIFKILPMQRYSAQEQYRKATSNTNPKSMPEIVIQQKLKVGVAYIELRRVCIQCCLI